MRDLFWRLPQWFPFLSRQQQVVFLQYRDLLLYYNKKINLISSGTVQEMDCVHFTDSIFGSQCIYSFLSSQSSSFHSKDTLYDLGSGNGFPGVVFAILYPHQKVCLVEIQSKKIEYLRQLISLLELQNVSLFHGSALSLSPQSVVYAVTRAYKPISYLLFKHRRIFSSQAQIFHFKGKNWQKELDRKNIGDKDSDKNRQWEHILLEKYQLPDKNSIRKTFIVKSSFI